MLFYVTRERSAGTIRRLLKSLETSWLKRPDFIRPVSYETLFELKHAPIANYVFTDFDRLSGYELDTVGRLANTLIAADPTVRISNWPSRAMGRYQLLRRLYEAGINSFNVWRLDEERAPTAYPVFIRREHDARGPETPLLHTEAEFRDAVAALQAEGKGLSGRIAVQYVPARTASGQYHKYGAYRFADRIVPQHLLVADNWIVKRRATVRDGSLSDDEHRFITQNPHANELMHVFELAQIDFGRIDYCAVNDRLEVFEINTNPQFPRARVTQDGSMIRRKLVVEGVLEGFRALDSEHAGRGLIEFHYARPRLQRMRARPLKLRFRDWVTARSWRAEFGTAAVRRPG